MTYDVKRMKAPVARGELLRVLANLVENPITGAILGEVLLKEAGIPLLRSTPCEEQLPNAHPLFSKERAPEEKERGPISLEALAVSTANPEGFLFETVRDFAAAYREQRSNPEEVAQRILSLGVSRDTKSPPMRTFISQDPADLMAQAKASRERFEQGRPLSLLDGVPVAVKDELDQRGYPTTVGTKFLGKTVAHHDATPVARLRSLGALLIGKANMHEIGIGVTGLNVHYGAVRNPYDINRASGGSSSGSAAAVASGLCPLSVGADGGGSIRIPAGYCGVVGLKATFGRVSEHLAAPLCWSVTHAGPIGATIADVAIGYAAMAGPDPLDPNSLYQPTPHLDNVFNPDLSGFKIGIYRAWFEDAEPEVVRACYRALDTLLAAGAQLVEIQIPELNLMRVVHLTTIVSEMATSQLQYDKKNRADYALDTRLNLAMARRLKASDYLLAQRHRVRLCRHFEEVLRQVDVIVTPAISRTAPVLSIDALQSGESNLEFIEQTMRFAMAGNVTGIPGLSLPAGYDAAGLPISLQLMGRPWQEATLLQMGAVVERALPRRKPQVHDALLPRP
jgi:Asp-tRNA(Asn)/Glu-tRNA(Gln) amidotransferase A subunit family amidase